jgi:hypothetical protein
VPQVRYEFVATGADSIASAFATINSAATRSARVVAAGLSSMGPAAERSSDRAAAAAERAAERKEAAEKKRLDRVKALFERYRERENDAILREVAAVERAEAKKAAAAEKAAAKATAARSKSLMNEHRAFDGTIRSFGGSALQGAGVLGAMAARQMVDAVKASMELQEQATRISINSRQAGETAIDPHLIRKDLENAAISNPGVRAIEVGQAVEKYVSLTGDVDTARKNAGTFALFSSATGAKSEEVAATAAALGDKFNVKNQADMQKAMSILTFQGKQGAFELKDMAAQFQRLATAAASFGIGQGTDAVAILGGFSQIARTGTGSGRMATTAVENVFATLSSKSGDLKTKHGIDVYGKGGSTRDIRDVLVDTISKVGGTDMEKKLGGLEKIFGKQGVRAIKPLFVEFQKAFQEAGGGKKGQQAGEEAVRAMFQKAIATSGDIAEIQRDAAMAQQSVANRLVGVQEELRAAVGDQALPAIAELGPELVQLAKDAIPLAVGALGALVFVTRAVVDAFQLLGIIKPNTPTKLAQHEEAQKALDKFDAAIEERGGPMTDEEAQRRDQLEEVVNGTYAAAYAGRESEGMGPEEFASEYARKLGVSESDSRRDRVIAEGQRLHSDPSSVQYYGDERTNSLVQGRADEQAQQAGLVTFINENAKRALSDAVDEVARNAKKAADSLAKVSPSGAGTIFPQGPGN